MTNALVPVSNSSALEQLGTAANHFAAGGVLNDYQSRRAPETLRRQRADLALFQEFLYTAGVTTGELASNLAAWRGITWGLVAAFVQWQLSRGYAIGSINVRLATVKTYAKLALKANTLAPEEFAMIKTVSGYRHKEGVNIDAQRDTTRVGSKKALPTSLTKELAKLLKKQPDTALGRRDALLVCLLLDHGLRCSEVVDLRSENLNIDEGTFLFYRRKVDKTQTHKMTRDTLRAARAYLEVKPDSEALLVGERFGKLSGAVTTRAINKRVQQLGARIGVEHLSPHDCRHYWATAATRNGANIKALQDAGGWNSPAMPLRYAESAEIANEGVNVE